MKLCKDCKWMSFGEFAQFAGSSERMDEMLWMIAECHHLSAREESPPNPVSGVVTKRWTTCSIHRTARYRDESNNCGPHGLYWEPKHPPHEPVGFADDDPPPRAGGAMAEPE